MEAFERREHRRVVFTWVVVRFEVEKGRSALTGTFDTIKYTSSTSEGPEPQQSSAAAAPRWRGGDADHVDLKPHTPHVHARLYVFGLFCPRFCPFLIIL